MSGISTNYSYNYNNSYYTNGLDANSWTEKAEQEAEKIKNSTKTSSTSSTSTTSSGISVGSSASNSTFLLAYQSQLEDLEASASKLQLSAKNNVFSKYDDAVKKAAEDPTGDNAAAVDKAVDNIVAAFKDLANKYNSTMSLLSNNVGRGSGISSQMDSLKRMMPNEKTLAALGMSYDTNGKIQVDEDALREALEKDPEEVKNLVGGQFGIAERVGSKATAILDSSVDKVIGSAVSSESSDSTKKTDSSSTTNSFTKTSSMSDSFTQFANFAKSGAFNLSNYYAVSMLNILA